MDTKYRSEVDLTTSLRLQMEAKEQELYLLKIQSEELDKQLREERTSIAAEREEWQQFQSDMLMVVRVAEDFKTEAACKVETVQKENSVLRDRVEALEKRPDTTEASVQVTPPPPSVAYASKATLTRTDSQISISSTTESVENFSVIADDVFSSAYYPRTCESVSSDADHNSDKENKHGHGNNASDDSTGGEEYGRESGKRILRTTSNSGSRRNCVLSDSSGTDCCHFWVLN